MAKSRKIKLQILSEALHCLYGSLIISVTSTIESLSSQANIIKQL